MTRQNETSNISPLVYARIAGFLYLLVIPLGIFGALYVPSRLIVSGNAAETAQNLIASEPLFRLGLVSDLLASILTLLVALVLYALLKSVSQNVAIAMVACVAIAVPMSLLNKLNQLTAIQLLSGADYLGTFTTDQLYSLAYQFIRMSNTGGTIAFIFWGLWLFPLGWLVFKSDFLPRILGILLMVACFGYVIDSFATLLGYPIGVGMVAAVGEIAFILWLLIKGVNVERWQTLALAHA